MHDIASTTTSIDETLKNIALNVSLSEDNIDWQKVEWYRLRFEMFKADNCPKANIAYVEKARADSSLNRETRLAIVRIAMSL